MGLPLNDKESLAGVFEIRARERAHFQRYRAVRTLAREALHGLSSKYIEEKSRGETDVYQGLKVPNSLILKIALDEAGRVIAKDPTLVAENVIDRLWNKASILAARKLLRQMNSQNGLDY